MLGSLLGVSLGEQLCAHAVGPGIVLGVHLVYDDLSGVVGIPRLGAGIRSNISLVF